MKKTVVILTKSSKNTGYCVAGIDVDTGEWVRFVSNNEETHGAVSLENIRYKDGSICEPLDVVSVECLRSTPTYHQPENWLIDSSKYWKKIDRVPFSDVLSIHPAENPTYVYQNINPYLCDGEMELVSQSLTLIKVSELSVSVTINGFGRPKTKARFRYNNKTYFDISVTDRDYYSISHVKYHSNAYIVVSLPDTDFPAGCYYKFIAKIFPV